MARVQIINEICNEIGGGWELCFQWCRYFFDEGDMLYGYRFIQRRPSGDLHAVRGQTRIPSTKIAQELIKSAIEEGWGNYDANDMTLSFEKPNLSVYDNMAAKTMRRWQYDDADQLADRIRKLPSVVVSEEGRKILDNPAVKVLDCVLSLNRQYKKFVEPRIIKFKKAYPNVKTLVELHNLVESCGGAIRLFRKQELDYYDDDRATTFNNVLEYMRNIEGITDDMDVSTQLEILNKWAIAEQPSGYKKMDVNGFGIAGWQYMRMLFGADTCKPDRYLIDFVKESIGKKVSPLTAVELIEAAAPRAGLGIREADRRIWKYKSEKQRRQSGGSCQL